MKNGQNWWINLCKYFGVPRTVQLSAGKNKLEYNVEMFKTGGESANPKSTKIAKDSSRFPLDTTRMQRSLKNSYLPRSSIKVEIPSSYQGK